MQQSSSEGDRSKPGHRDSSRRICEAQRAAVARPPASSLPGDTLGHRVGDVAQHVGDLAADLAHRGDGHNRDQ
jgi:hypothetical protein